MYVCIITYVYIYIYIHMCVIIYWVLLGFNQVIYLS